MSEGTGNPGSPGNSGPGVSKRSEGMRIGRARKKRPSRLSAVRIRFLFTAASGNAAGRAADFHALPGWIRSRRASDSNRDACNSSRRRSARPLLANP